MTTILVVLSSLFLVWSAYLQVRIARLDREVMRLRREREDASWQRRWDALSQSDEYRVWRSENPPPPDVNGVVRL